MPSAKEKGVECGWGGKLVDAVGDVLGEGEQGRIGELADAADQVLPVKVIQGDERLIRESFGPSFAGMSSDFAVLVVALHVAISEELALVFGAQ